MSSGESRRATIRPVDLDTANDGSIEWTIPADLPPGDDYFVGIQWKTWNGLWAVSDGPFTIAADADAPAVSNVAAVPATLKEGVDDSLLLTATATDEGGTIAGAEYFVGTDPGAATARRWRRRTGRLVPVPRP